MAVCIVGKDNSPQYIAITDSDCELELQYLAHASLDVVEEKCSIKPKQDTRDLYLGLLYATQKYKIFGYVTNTKIKFLLVIETGNTTLRENEVRTMFKNLHTLYADAVCNPFYTSEDPLLSETFNRNVRHIISGGGSL